MQRTCHTQAETLKLSEVVEEVEKKQTPLSEFFRQPPLAELDLERDKSPITRSDLAELLDEPS
jgi:hypothetical protein